jgi:universal stress protein E
MDPIRKILAIVDPTATDQPCVQKAARLARATGAKLELFICDFASDLRPSRFVLPQAYEAALAKRDAQLIAQLEALAEPLRQQGLQVLADVAFDEPLHCGILNEIVVSGADIVLKDTHYHGALRRALFTNTDWHLIRECRVPLLLTKAAPWPQQMNLSAALDPGHSGDKPAALDRELLDGTEYLAACLHAAAAAVHVFNPAPVLASMAPIGAGAVTFAGADFLNELRATHLREFNTLLADHPAIAGRAQFLDGVPGLVFPEYVSERAIDVLVMGAIARGALQRLLVGSTAERLLDRLPCDILVMKPRRLVEKMASVQSAA